MASFASPIPKYCLQFITSPDLHIDHPNEARITQRQLTPINAQIPQPILTLFECFAMDYVYLLGSDFKGTKEFRISVSSEKGGILENCTDDKMREVFKNMESHVVAVPESNIGGFKQIKKGNPTKDIIEKTEEKFKGETVCYFDPIAFNCAQAGIPGKLRLDLEISPFVPSAKGGGLTTGSLRFPHLLKDLWLHLQNTPNPSICIVGPGLQQEPGSIACCPQFVEIHSLFPQGSYLLLENNEKALEILKNQFHKCKFAGYDPLTLRILTTLNNDNYAPEHYQKLFLIMKSHLAEKAIKPKPDEALKMLSGIGPIKPLVFKVVPEKIEVRKFDINTSQFKPEEERTFDAVIATMSIFLALNHRENKNTHFNPYEVLGKHLMLLKENGSLYIDSHLREMLTPDSHIRLLGIRYLEALSGNRIAFREIPLSDFIPTATGTSGTTISPSIQEANLGLLNDVTTSSIGVITRTAEKVDPMSPEEFECLGKRLTVFVETVDENKE